MRSSFSISILFMHCFDDFILRGRGQVPLNFINAVMPGYDTINIGIRFFMEDVCFGFSQWLLCVFISFAGRRE